MSEIDNPTIRASAETRTNRLREAQARITNASLAARDTYEPFMRDLQDVRKCMAGDPSPSSAQMLSEVNVKAQSNGAFDKQKLDALIAELDAVRDPSAS